MKSQEPRPAGIACRRCGCEHCSVSHTEKLPSGKIRRRRVCRHCGAKFVTFELSAADMSANGRKPDQSRS
jgi:transcriptional regulator NrdR family protein